MLAIYENKLDMVKILLEHQADPNTMLFYTYKYISPLLLSLKCCQMMIAQGVENEINTAQSIYNVLKDYGADLKCSPNQIPFKGDMAFGNFEYHEWDMSVNQQLHHENLEDFFQQMEQEYLAYHTRKTILAEMPDSAQVRQKRKM